jgi:hypothetical protein
MAGLDPAIQPVVFTTESDAWSSPCMTVREAPKPGSGFFGSLPGRTPRIPTRQFA